MSQPERQNKRYKVLCIEDDKIVRNNLLLFLEDEGYEVFGAADGLEGLDLFRLEKPAVVLSDLRMPGVNGLEVLKTVKQESPNTEVIIVSGTGREQDLVQCINMGAFRYFPKPANLVEIGAEVKTAIEFSELKSRDKAYKNQLENLVADLQNEVSKHKQTEIDLLAAKKAADVANETKSEFLANISHELRTPMHSILSYSKFGWDKIQTAPKDKQLHYFKQINRSGHRLMVLLNDLLDLSKLESGQFEYHMKLENIQGLVESSVAEFQSPLTEQGITVEIEKPAFTTSVECDAYKIEQVMRNLISNAIKFSPPHKQISVSFTQTQVSAGRRATDDVQTPGIQVSVKDQGVGIPDDELESIFDKFIQSSKTKTGAGGTGLGLAICFEIIKFHQGSIWAENNPRGGTIISFKLPYQHV